jgi:hypothetical protein
LVPGAGTIHDTVRGWRATLVGDILATEKESHDKGLDVEGKRKRSG